MTSTLQPPITSTSPSSMKTIFVVFGCSRVGKSTVASHLASLYGWQFVEGDTATPSLLSSHAQDPDASLVPFHRADSITSEHSIPSSSSDAAQFHPSSNIKKMRAGVPLSDTDRQTWLEDIAMAAVTQLGMRTDVVIACSALRRKHRDIFRTVIGRHNFKEHKDIRINFLFLQMSEIKAKTLVEIRGKLEGHFMPGALVHSQFKTLEPPTTDEVDLCRR